jgi:hypothetical protein
MTSENKKYAILAVLMFAILSALTEYAITYLFGGNALENALHKIAFYAAFAIICLFLWFVGIKIMHLDAKGPVPWYASPVLWLIPLLLLTLTLMFRGGV